VACELFRVVDKSPVTLELAEMLAKVPFLTTQDGDVVTCHPAAELLEAIEIMRELKRLTLKLDELSHRLPAPK